MHFGTWNLYAPLTNLCLSVLVFPLMGVSLFGLVFAWCPWILCVCNTAASWMASVMLAVAGGVASLPCSYLSSAPPAGENEAVIVPLQKDAWSAVISNPALVVAAGTENAVRYTLLPVLKARGIRPSGVLASRNGRAERAGVEALAKEYPGIRNWGAADAECSVRKWRFRPGNELVLEDFPVPLSTGIHQDRSRVLSWKCRGQCVLMIGNAGFSSLARAAMTPRADVLVIGHHPRDPVASAAWIRATGARAVIFTTEHECPVPGGNGRVPSLGNRSHLFAGGRGRRSNHPLEGHGTPYRVNPVLSSMRMGRSSPARSGAASTITGLFWEVRPERRASFVLDGPSRRTS